MVKGGARASGIIFFELKILSTGDILLLSHSAVNARSNRGYIGVQIMVLDGTWES